MKGKDHVYEWLNGIPLNDTKNADDVNFFQYSIFKGEKRVFRSSWVTDIKITSKNIKELVKCGRAKWKIENESFDILAKVDRAAMAVSLELRNPILDHRVVEFAWRLPVSMKTDGHTGKIILKKVMDRYVPRAITYRPKSGLGAPTFDWLAGPLRDWAEDLLSENGLASEGLFAPKLIRGM